MVAADHERSLTFRCCQLPSAAKHQLLLPLHLDSLVYTAVRPAHLRAAHHPLAAPSVARLSPFSRLLVSHPLHHVQPSMPPPGCRCFSAPCCPRRSQIRYSLCRRSEMPLYLIRQALLCSPVTTTEVNIHIIDNSSSPPDHIPRTPAHLLRSSPIAQVQTRGYGASNCLQTSLLLY